MNLLTDAELAERMTLELEKFHQLRKRHGWPCVRLGRFEYRFTEAQVEQIIAMHSEGPKKKAAPAAGGVVPGQTAKSAARTKRSA